jgi:hypothetical protein
MGKQNSFKSVAMVGGVEVQARGCCAAKPLHSFHCARCGVGLAARPPRQSTAARLDAWFACHGWDASSGRPLCGGCAGTPSAPAAPVIVEAPAPAVALAGALVSAEEQLARGGVRGKLSASPLGTVVQVTWSSPSGSRGDIEREALRAAERALADAGFDAQKVPGMSFVRVMLDPAQLIGADEPGRDHEHVVRSDEAFVERYELELDQAAE